MTSTSDSVFTSRLQQVPIAIIGMACVFPQSRHLREYWDNIIRGVDSVTDVPADRWDIQDYYDPNPKAPDKTYCKRGGFLPDIDFDPIEFGMPPNILEVTDVSQLLSLVVAKEVLEDAGYGDVSGFNRDRIGIVLGVGGGQKLIAPLNARLQYPVWKKVLRKSGISEEDTEIIIEKMKKAYVPWEENSFPGMLGNVISGRVTNRLNLGGINCVLDAACASSMAALKMAISELLEYRSDIMITGGVDTDNSIHMYLAFSKTPAFTADEQSRPFDVDSSGMLIGEGVGMVALKRLEDAECDGDRIYALIRGIGTSSDGRFKSIYNPRPEGQVKAIERAYQDAGVSPSSVGLIEAHGTGTKAGDLAEVAALREVFSEGEHRNQHVALGSVKSQVGHTKAAAGVAGLIKATMALYHKVLPPTINVSKPDPRLDLEHSPFYLNTETRPWIHPENGAPRRASVSAFGFGGTNFHVVLEEYERKNGLPYRMHTVPQCVLLSANTPEELAGICGDILHELQSRNSAGYYQELLESCRSSEIPTDAARLGFVSESLPETIELLQLAIRSLQTRVGEESWELPKGIYYRQRGQNLEGKVVALFSGQGSQYVDMGKELVYNFPPLMNVYRQMDWLFTQDGLEPLSDKVFPRPVFDPMDKNAAMGQLTQTEYAQPAIGTFSAGLYKILEKAGFQPDFLAGHSFGELTALWAAQVLSDADFFALARTRGKAMAVPYQSDSDAGAMLAVIGNFEEIQANIIDFPTITIANVNSKQEVVVAGPSQDIDALRNSLETKSFRVVPLPVSAAFHTKLVGHAQEPFAMAIRDTTFRSPRHPVYSNTTGQPYPTNPAAIQSHLEGHILNPVLFRQEIENIYNDGGRLFIEFGPKGVLTKLVSNILEGKPHIAIALNPSPEKGSDRQLRQAVIRLQVAGLPLRDIDCYQAEGPPPKEHKPSPSMVRLNGANYVSDKTRKAFMDALNDGHQVGQVPASVEERQPPTSEMIKEQDVQYDTVPTTEDKCTTSPSPPVREGVDSQRVLESVEQSLSLFYKHESETLEAHQQYLNNHLEYTQTFYKLMQQQYSLLADGSCGDVPDGVGRSMLMFHNHQGETLDVHAKYLINQAETSRSALQVMKQQSSLLSGANLNQTGTEAAPQATLPAIAPVSEVVPQKPVSQTLTRDTLSTAISPVVGPNIEALTQTMLEVVSDKTGYPVEMLELDMEIEADLGIDSIKRVEILGTMMEIYPDLPEIDPEELAELRTLRHVAEHIRLHLSVGVPTAQSVPVVSLPTMGPSIETLTHTMLEVVSDKTGYPVEMLELDMEIEADLGIDSIKRVEILGTMMEIYPELPEIDPEELAELRTLRQVAEYMEHNLSGACNVVQPGPINGGKGITSLTTLLEASQATAYSAMGAEAKELSQMILGVVSDETSYPVEMLELDMAIESELGIDRIKLIEIMEAIRSQYPGLSDIDHDNLTELRTLEDMVLYVQESLAYVEPSGEESLPSRSGIESTVSQGFAKLKMLPAPDFLEFNLSDGDVCLLTDDGSQTVVRLAESLSKKRWKVVVLSFPGSMILERMPLPQGVPRIVLDDLSETCLEGALGAISKDYGEVGGFIHLSPKLELDSTDGILFSETGKDVLRHVFLIAKHLKAPLTRSSPIGRRFFITVARLNGMLGVGQGDFGVADGGLFGLTKTLNLEWRSVFCRAIDLSPDLDTGSSVLAIVQELHDSDCRIVETGHGPQGRVTLVTEERAVVPFDENNGQVDSTSVFLVSGGAKGITSECVVKLASVCHSKFVLLGRSELFEEEPTWARDCFDEVELKRRIMEELKIQGEKPTPVKVEEILKPILSSREIAGTLEAIRQAGGKAEYLSVDITNAEALQELTPAIHRFGTVTGIIHGAGVLADRLIEKKTADDFESVYSTKVKGLQSLLSCVDNKGLRHLILFSSAAGFFGNPGQSDYAIANEILNKLAYQFRYKYPDCHVISFNWGPWDGGMVSESLRKMFAERNIQVIPIEAGTNVFVNMLTTARQEGPQILVGSSMLEEGGEFDPELRVYRLVRSLKLGDNPFLMDHVIGGQAVLPAAFAIAWMVDTCEQLYPGDRFSRCENYRTLKGIVLNETSADDYIMDIHELRKDISGEVVFDVMISSHQLGEKLAPHYSAQIVLLPKILDVPIYENFDIMESGMREGMSFYQDGTLFHGPVFHTVDRMINITRERLTIQCRVPQIDEEGLGQFPVRAFDPFAVDVAFQGMLIWARKYYDTGSLPSKAQTVEFYRTIPAYQTFYVTLDIRKSTQTNVVGDITAHDDTGRIFTRILGAEVTISKTLDQRFSEVTLHREDVQIDRGELQPE